VREPDEILHLLTEAEDLPKEALEAATVRQAEMVPLFLEVIEEFLAAPAKARAEPTALFYIFHLMGSWRKKSAYRPLARFLRCEQADDILGEATTTASHRVMAAVFDGDPQPLYDIILDPAADQFVRSRMCEALAILVLRGDLDRSEAICFFKDAFEKIKPRNGCFVWQGWQSAVAMLGARELKPVVKQAFDHAHIDSRWLRFQDFEKDLEFAIEHPGKSRLDNDGPYTLFGDTIEELSTWYGFSEKYKEDRERWEPNADEDILVSKPYINALRGVGRNDPCPCGSGRKFKKCCMR
jgi:hypothetical protein